MVTLDWDVDRADGVTFVRVSLTASQPRRVRVEHRLDGPLWPPRRRGQPAPGWDGDGFDGVVSPDDRLVAGYATPAPPEDPPVELVSDEPVDTGDDTGPTSEFDTGLPSVESTPAGVVQSLGDPVVPRDAVPVPEPGATESTRPPTSSPPPSEAAEHQGVAAGGRGTDGDRTDGSSMVQGADGRDGSTAERSDAAMDASDTWPAERSGPGGRGATLVVPGAVRAWLADVERRVGAVERQGTADPESALGTAVAGDRQALARVARRVTTLTERVDGIDGFERGNDGERGGESTDPRAGRPRESAAGDP